jgi:nicotinate phosphoribosyltransferase
MCQPVLHQFANTMVKYSFKCRNEDVKLGGLSGETREEIEHLCSLRFAKNELDFLDRIPFFKESFIAFLRNFKLNKDCVKISEKDGDLCLSIEGTWLETILFEVPILSIINEVYFRKLSNGKRDYLSTFEERVKEKKKILATAPDGFTYTDFGTRRRFNFEIQKLFISNMLETGRLIGTSNLYFAKVFDIKFMGTQAHEWYQAGQAMNTRLDLCQKFMLDAWMKEYRGDLGIALTDCICMDAFLRDFDLLLSNSYQGMRHDSGDPYCWGEKAIAHYEKWGIDPKTKTLVFSDGLDILKSIDLYNHFSSRINTGFGIGTSNTNDVGYKPLNIVIKMVECNGLPVAKISDSPGKGMCKDKQYLDYLKKVYRVA